MAASPPRSAARGKRGTAMLIPTLVMAALALLVVILAYRRGGGQHIVGMRMAWTTLIETLPLLVFSFIVAGLVQVLLPRDLVSRWVGTESGARGLLIGTVAGALTPGGPYVSFPVIAGLLNAGAGVGTMVQIREVGEGVVFRVRVEVMDGVRRVVGRGGRVAGVRRVVCVAW